MSAFMTGAMPARSTTMTQPVLEKSATIGVTALPQPAGAIPKSGEIKVAECSRFKYIEILVKGAYVCIKVMDAVGKLIEKCHQEPDKTVTKQVCADNQPQPMPPQPHFPKPGVQQ